MAWIKKDPKHKFVYRGGSSKELVALVDSEDYTSEDDRTDKDPFAENTKISSIQKYVQNYVRDLFHNQRYLHYGIREFLQPIRDIKRLEWRKSAVKEIYENNLDDIIIELVEAGDDLDVWDKRRHEMIRQQYFRPEIEQIDALAKLVAVGKTMPDTCDYFKAVRKFADDISNTSEYNDLQKINGFFKENLSEETFEVLKYFDSVLVGVSRENLFDLSSISKRYKKDHGSGWGYHDTVKKAARIIGEHKIDLDIERVIYQVAVSLKTLVEKAEEDPLLQDFFDLDEMSYFELKDRLDEALRKPKTKKRETDEKTIFSQDLFKTIIHVSDIIAEGLEKRMMNLYVDVKELTRESAFYLGLAGLTREFAKTGDICMSVTLPKEERMHVYLDARIPSLTLKEDFGEEIIPNDFIVTPEESTQSLSGPNQSGKSTYSRGFPQLSYLHQIGSYIPAVASRDGEQTRASIVDGIFTSFIKGDNPDDDEGLYLAQLEFAKHITYPPKEISGISDDGEIAKYLGKMYKTGQQTWVTPYSLAVIDDFLIGTDNEEETGRLKIFLDELNARGTVTIVPTHKEEVTQLIEEGAIPNAINLATEVTYDEKDKMVFTRKIIRGKRERSYGNVLAESVGITPEGMREARELLNTYEIPKTRAIKT